MKDTLSMYGDIMTRREQKLIDTTIQLCVYSDMGAALLTLSESSIAHQIKEALQYSGWYVIRNQQSMGSHRGLSDYTIIRDGKVIFLEIKKPTGKLSDYQKKFQAEIIKHGGEYVVARSIDDIKYLCDGYINF